jgi:hypothetical protein
MHRSILDSVVCGIVSSEKLLEFIEGTQEGLRECPLELLPGCKGVGSGQETVVGLSNKVVAINRTKAKRRLDVWRFPRKTRNSSLECPLRKPAVTGLSCKSSDGDIRSWSIRKMSPNFSLATGPSAIDHVRLAAAAARSARTHGSITDTSSGISSFSSEARGQ